MTEPDQTRADLDAALSIVATESRRFSEPGTLDREPDGLPARLLRKAWGGAWPRKRADVDAFAEAFAHAVAAACHGVRAHVAREGDVTPDRITAALSEQRRWATCALQKAAARHDGTHTGEARTRSAGALGNALGRWHGVEAIEAALHYVRSEGRAGH